MIHRESGSGDDECGQCFLPQGRFSPHLHGHRGDVHNVDMGLKGMSAVDMFVKQVQGKLMPAGVAERQKQLGQERTRSHEGVHQHTYPVTAPGFQAFGQQRSTMPT